MSAPWVVAVVSLWVFAILLAIVLLGTLRRITGVLEHAEATIAAAGGASLGGVAVGSAVPPFELFDEHGAPHPSEQILDPTVPLFFSSGCVACQELAASFDGIRDAIDGVPFAIVLEDVPESHAFPLPTGLRVLYDREHRVADAFENVATPQAYVVDRGGIVLDKRIPGSVVDLRQMASLQREGARAGVRPSATAKGERT